MRKSALKIVVLYLLLMTCFCALMTISYCIPVELLHLNGEESAKLLEEEGSYPKSYISGIAYDNYTCAVMINEAVHGGGSSSPFVAAMKNPFVVAGGGSGVESLSGWAEDPGQIAEGEYSRYWNGYLVFLKPLLLLFDVQEIRAILCVLFAIAFVVCVVALLRRLGQRIGAMVSVALGATMAYCGFFENASVLPFFFSFFLSIAGIVWVARMQITADRVITGFFVLGALTVFFDFLDNPILTLGLPLCVLIVRLGGLKDESFRDACIYVLAALVFWGVSYASIWAGKWVVASLATGNNVISNAIDQILFRVGSNDSMMTVETSVVGALRENLKTCGLGFVLLLLGFGCLAASAALAAKNWPAARRLFKRFVPLVVIAAIPFMWTAVLSNHSQIHFWFTWRNFSITVFALLILLGIVALSCKPTAYDNSTCEKQ